MKNKKIILPKLIFPFLFLPKILNTILCDANGKPITSAPGGNPRGDDDFSTCDCCTTTSTTTSTTTTTSTSTTTTTTTTTSAAQNCPSDCSSCATITFTLALNAGSTTNCTCLNPGVACSSMVGNYTLPRGSGTSCQWSTSFTGGSSPSGFVVAVINCRTTKICPGDQAVDYWELVISHSSGCEYRFTTSISGVCPPVTAGSWVEAGGGISGSCTAFCCKYDITAMA